MDVETARKITKLDDRRREVEKFVKQVREVTCTSGVFFEDKLDTVVRGGILGNLCRILECSNSDIAAILTNTMEELVQGCLDGINKELDELTGE